MSIGNTDFDFIEKILQWVQNTSSIIESIPLFHQTDLIRLD